VVGKLRLGDFYSKERFFNQVSSKNT